MTKSSQQKNDRDDNSKILLGCGGSLIVIFFVAGFLLLSVLNSERQRARFPGATSISSHSNYSGLPFQYRWDDSYLIRDNFRTVYQWYSVTFDLGAESRANGDCIQLDGQKTQLMVTRSINVLLCSTPAGQRAYVTRVTAVQR